MITRCAGVILATALAACSAPARHANQDPALALAAACLDVGLTPCMTTEGGYFRADSDVIFWQIQERAPNGAGLRGTAFVLATIDEHGALEVVNRSGDTRDPGAVWFYDPPKLIRMGDELYLASAGAMFGTGTANADVIYHWAPGHSDPITKVDNEHWRSALSQRLPLGLRVRKGVIFRYGDESVSASTALWRAQDGDCCPTGGEADLTFELQDNRLVLTDVSRRG